MKLLRDISFAVWIILFSIFGFVFCLIRWGHPNLVCWLARLYSWGVCKIYGFKVVFENADRLEATQPCVYVANHQSGIDLSTFGVRFPHRTVGIGKKEILWIPFFGIVFKASGNILLDRQNKKRAIGGLSNAVEAIRKRRISIWIYPEGTRNRSLQGLLPFKKGAFHMAIGAQVPIVPAVCSSLKPLQRKSGKGFLPGTIRIRVLPPIPTAGLTIGDVDRLSDRVREAMLTALQELN